MIETSQSTRPLVEQWEETGTTLANVLDKYLHLCLFLGTSTPQSGILSESLATRIDSALSSLHVTISQQIARARSALALTRNKILSPIHRLPPEVLAEIFSYVLYQPPDPYCHTSMADSLVKMYRTLHNLLAVCSTWKTTVLAQGSFWSTVPIIHSPPSQLHFEFPQATGLSLERAGNADLHLAAIIPDWDCSISSNELAKRARQFRTINIKSNTYNFARRIMDIFKDFGTSNRLTELSLYRESDEDLSDMHPTGFDYIIYPHAVSQPVFHQILKSLSVFRLCGAPVYLNNVHFSNRLVELHLQTFTLGYDSEINKLITALSSATDLRILKVISITTFLDPEESDEIAGSKILLPRLQTLLAQDLYANTLETLLPAITSRTHALTLHLTSKALRVLHPHEAPQPTPLNDLATLLAGISVNTLLLEGEESRDGMAERELWDFLGIMPELETLKMHNLLLDDGLCHRLEQLSNDDELGGGSSRLVIKNLHITSSQIWDEVTFRAAVASHLGSIERMELGAEIYFNYDYEQDDEKDVSVEWKPLSRENSLVQWLAENVPEFKLHDFDDDPKEFVPLEWPLW